ncbi:MAG: HAMP domain-containing protein [Bdellovibrionales bacterium]|nr:HAMP domain-containing protein [Bdellovibrionales bacterium]
MRNRPTLRIVNLAGIRVFVDGKEPCYPEVRVFKSLRSKVFAFLSCLLLVSLTGVGISFWITQRVNSRLSEINLRSVPMQRELTQLSSDTELLKREMERSLGFSHWSDPRWKPRRIPSWAAEVHRSTLERIQKDFLVTDSWRDWEFRIRRLNGDLSSGAENLFVELHARHQDRASVLYPEWMKSLEMLQKEVEWAKREIDQETRAAFRDAQKQVQNLRMVLQLLLLVVIGVALIVIWMGERALRPIDSLRAVVKQVSQRGSLTRDDRAGIPAIPIGQKDEVSELAREFNQMATTLIERERMIEHQKARLEEQNKALMEMGELQKRLQQAEHLAAVGRLSAQVAHEVGNPLHSIGLESELALEVLNRMAPERSASAISIKQSLSSITTSVERLQKIIQNYLKLSRITPDRIRPVDLKICAENAIATYANELQRGGIEMEWYFDPTLSASGQVAGDPDLMEYAIGNLIRNSIQALEKTPKEERKITIRIEAGNGNRVNFEFMDTGPGMDAAVRSNLFKPFFTTKANGTGLGLSFVKKVFTDAGGSFELKSVSLNPGAHFAGFLPTMKERVILAPEANV